MSASSFPLVDALIMTPPEGAEGSIGICTNTTAPGQVLNEIEEANRAYVSVLGSLIVSRDGAERMILNALSHPSLSYVILFSEESLTFSPSTNLLLAMMHGLEEGKSGNYIKDGKAASAHYPNLSKKIVDAFRENIVVLPLFMYASDYSKPVVEEYLSWLPGRVSHEVIELLTKANNKKKIYYDTLNELLVLLAKEPRREKSKVALDPKDFQHLQPPRIEVGPEELPTVVPFQVIQKKHTVEVRVKCGDTVYAIEGDDEFLLEYSLMRGLGEDKKHLPPLTQLLLGAEISRVFTARANEIEIPSWVTYEELGGTKHLELESNVSLKPDTEFYYKISVRGGKASVMCMAFDVCVEVYDLMSTDFGGLVTYLAEKNRFEEYEMDILHRIDVGGQIARAVFAANNDYQFIQDFPIIFKVNESDLPLLLPESDSFLDTHKRVLMDLYTKGLTEDHADAHKGIARSGVVLAMYRDAEKAFESMPKIYAQGEHSGEVMREAYKKQLLRLDHDGDYSYGQRTRVHFEVDQIDAVIEALKKEPTKATAIQRFDPIEDMRGVVDTETGVKKYTHDPCLTHDVFFRMDGKLHSLHIARAHNTVNAYPENLFGLYDAYTTTVKETLYLPGGDFFMLSSRANILLLTEEQRTRKILGEPSKPPSEMNTDSGPKRIGENYKHYEGGGVTLLHEPLVGIIERPKSPILDRLENFEGVNTIEKAINYLKERGPAHNNPVLGEYYPRNMDPSGSYLLFFQANVFGGKLHTTAVFTNTTPELEKHREIVSYLASRHVRALGTKLGNATILWVNGE